MILCWMYHAIGRRHPGGGMARHGAPVFWNVRQSLDDPASLTRSSASRLRRRNVVAPAERHHLQQAARSNCIAPTATQIGNRGRHSQRLRLPQVAAPEPRTARRSVSWVASTRRKITEPSSRRPLRW